MARFNLDDYVDVQTRISRFWTEYPEGAIVTAFEGVTANFDTCRYSAAVYKDKADPLPSAKGYAYEVRQDQGSGPNVTSHEENCETSAIGRALANMGYATTGKDRPSRQEMTKANRGYQAPREPQRPPVDTETIAAMVAPQRPQNGQSGPSREASPAQHGKIRALANERGLTDHGLHVLAKRDTLKGVSMTDMSLLIDRIDLMSHEEVDAANSVVAMPSPDDAPPDSRSDDEIGWNTFWPLARANGIANREAFEAYIGEPMGTMSPGAALALLRELRGPEYAQPATDRPLASQVRGIR